MEKLSLDDKSLKRFGVTMGVAFVVIAMLLIIRHKHTWLSVLLISVSWFIFAFAMPRFLKPLYILWMKFAFMLNWINTRVILFVIFYLFFTPIGIIMRIFGVDLLHRKIDKRRDSYWQKTGRKDFNQLDYERQF